MANYYGAGRTNAFAVKDVQALKDVLESHDFTVEETAPGRVVILADDPDGGGYWSRWTYDEVSGEDHELFVPDLIAEHLQDGQVAVFVHAGAEKLRYITGYSIAVHSDGRQVRIDLDDIYTDAAALFGVAQQSIPHACWG
ncbi:hypothetical protein [Mycobacterium avium]|uniref:hypothetical protein n=1 Tax=Mycobacterium avium TaxID=1764 RepID=UPI000A0089B2|nr:hypothetical protein [Mycobacterium avium]